MKTVFLTLGYKIDDNVLLQFDNQNVSRGKYHKGVKNSNCTL